MCYYDEHVCKLNNLMLQLTKKVQHLLSYIRIYSCLKISLVNFIKHERTINKTENEQVTLKFI